MTSYREIEFLLNIRGRLSVKSTQNGRVDRPPISSHRGCKLRVVVLHLGRIEPRLVQIDALQKGPIVYNGGVLEYSRIDMSNKETGKFLQAGQLPVQYESRLIARYTDVVERPFRLS